MVDFANGLALGVAGDVSGDAADRIVADATDVLRAVAGNTSLASAEGADALDDVIIVAGQRYHILRFTQSGLDVRSFSHCWFDRDEANLALVRRQLRGAMCRITEN